MRMKPKMLRCNEVIQGVQMGNVKRMVFSIFTLLVLFATIVFMLENRQAVPLVFFGWSLPELSVSVLLVLALLMGMAIGPFLALILTRKKRNSARVV